MAPPAVAPDPLPLPLPPPPPNQPLSPANPFDFESAAAAGQARPRPRPRDSNEDDDDAPRSRVAHGRCAGFATGCTLAKWGAVVEIIGVAYLFLLTELILLESLGTLRITRALTDIGMVIIVPFFLPLLIGTAMMGIGRMRMADVPPHSGAGTLIATAGIATFIRFLLLFLAATLLAIASSERMGGKYAGYAIGAMLAGWAIGTLAEINSVAGIGAVGAAMQNRQLYSSAANSGMLHLVIGLVFSFLFLLSFLAGFTEVLERGENIPKPGLAIIIQLLVFGLQIVFTYAQYTLYAAGELTGRTRRDAT